MLDAISPVDGRYAGKTETLRAYFSELALIRYRVRIEVAYLEALGREGLVSLDHKQTDLMQQWVNTFSLEDARRVKDIESVTNHDVKAVEYFLRERMETAGMKHLVEYVHFGLTSQDINNTAIPLSLKNAWDNVLEPAYREVVQDIYTLAKKWEKVPMLARTHGQPASPTRLGKELMVFVERLNKQLSLLQTIPWAAKFGGATGNMNAHVAAFPDTDWPAFADNFCQHLGLQRSVFTTQIEHYDMLAAHFQGIGRLNTILIDLARDIWSYIAMEYFRQKLNEREVGSSAMPHKVNPIDFENAEGNLGMANALCGFLADKLPVSRLQRDLTDSTVLRNIGIPYAHTLIACQSIRKGLSKIILNEEALRKDLQANWSVLAEAIQTILRREKYPDPYNALKDLTRGKAHLSREDIFMFIDQLDIPPHVREELKQWTPETYVGVTPDF